MKIVLIGEVDHGKSTLIGRILADTGTVMQSKLDNVAAQCKAKGKPFEYAYLLDALEEEQVQGITIDSTRVNFSHKNKPYTLIDCPGHIEFIRNMVTGSSGAEIAILMIDCIEGVTEQTLRHYKIARLLGINKVVGVINKIDLVDFPEKKYLEIKNNLNFLDEVIPVSAKLGLNLLKKDFSWFNKSFFDTLETFSSEVSTEKSYLSVQDVYRFKDRYIASYDNLFSEGQHYKYPGGEQFNLEKLDDFGGFRTFPETFMESGNFFSKEKLDPINNLSCELFLLEEPLKVNQGYTLELESCKIQVKISRLGENNFKNGIVKTNLSFRTQEILPSNNVILKDLNGKILSFGYITERKNLASENITWSESNILLSDRNSLIGQEKNKVYWFTGLSGSGKSTCAKKLAKDLHSQGKLTYILDGDNIRHGLCSDLGFSKESRDENIRRVSHVTKLMYDAGVNVICCFISPMRQQREFARKIIGEDFIEVYMDYDFNECSERDPKGLYKKVFNGEIKDFTGYDSPYEVPINPEIKLREYDFEKFN